MSPRRLAVALLLFTSTAEAGIVDVTTTDELVAAVAAAQPGDEIVLADGTYPMGDVSCSAAGRPDAPIIVRAATQHGAKIKISGVEGFKVTGPHWQFDGLDIEGVCAADSDCEHAFHVSGKADGFVLRRSRVVDFNAQLKVNASKIGDVFEVPDGGLIEGNEVGDTRGRNTSNPTTKLNIDTGDGWVVRGNYLHDAQKLGGDNVSYAAFMKSGGTNGVFERNLVVCSRVTTGGTRIGLSFGGGGTGAQYCAPAFDPAVPCAVEHTGGVIRNNIIANCSDVGIYLNKARDTHVLYNSILGTAGVDFRFETSSGEVVGNLITGAVRMRDGGTATIGTNADDLDLAALAMIYRAPLEGDLAVIGDTSRLVGAGPAREDVTNDYCAQTRPSGALTLGAIEHSIATCDTTFPPAGGGGGNGDGDAGIGGGDGGGGGGGDGDDSGGCCDAGRDGGGAATVLALVVGLVVRRRRRT